MPDSYMIVFEGTIREGHDPSEVNTRLAGLLRVDEARVAQLFSGARVVLWRNLDIQAATRLKHAVEATGAECRLRRMRGDGESEPSVTLTAQRTVETDNKQAGAAAKLKSESSPAPEVKPPQPPTPPPLALPKCPKCGYVPRDTEDELVKSKQCPACGIVVTKYHAVVESRTSPPDTGPVEPTAAVAPATEPPAEDVDWDSEPIWDEAEGEADWRVFSRGTAILSLLVALLFTFPPFLKLGSRPMFGLAAGLLSVLTSSLAYRCYLIYVQKRDHFSTYVLLSAGLFAVLAGIGAVLYRLFAAVGVFFSTDRWWGQFSFVRVGIALSAIYLGSVGSLAYFGQPNGATTRQPSPSSPRLSGGSSFDIETYAGRVLEAKRKYGARFPAGERAAQYTYYRLVYCDPAQGDRQPYSRVLSALLPDFELADFHIVQEAEIELMVLNAIGFRQQLAEDGLISEELQRRLENLAWAWAEPSPYESQGLSFSDRVAKFDSRCPLDSLDYLKE